MLVDVEESPDLTQGSWKKLYRAEVDADGIEVVVNKEGDKHFWPTRTLGYVLDESVSMVCRHKKKGDELQCFQGTVPPGIERQSTPGFCPDTPYTLAGAVQSENPSTEKKQGSGKAHSKKD